MLNAKQIIRAAESLPVEERAIIVDSLLRTLNAPDPDVDRQWIEVAQRRLAQLRSGDVKSVAGDTVFEKIGKRFAE